MTRARFALAALIALGVAGAACLVAPAPADAQKPGGTLTIVRPTDPVSLDPQLETTAPGAWVY
ncbi:MAG TPA: D-alanyl-D-alanine dipeptidase, partial [Candidatus Dormibacteraeota bacterium]|nr:D-alanyl-D-alanine dipeptidase [Candidatus Dormibacteraeota bacterium]